MNIKESTDQLNRFRQICRENRLRLTPQRIAIYKQLLASKEHPAADDVYQQVKKGYQHISFDTVYRTLLTFVEIGLIRAVEGYGEPRRFDPDLSCHHHLRCLRCNAIIDFECGEFKGVKLPDSLKDKFKVINQRLVLEGLCGKCQKEDRPQDTK